MEPKQDEWLMELSEKGECPVGHYESGLDIKMK